MTEVFIGFVSALWLGILTSISPCPLASNVAAISFLSKKITHPVLVSISGLAYTLGRMVSYVVLSWIIISSLLSVPQVAQLLQKYASKALGPLLILTGLILLEVITIRLPGVPLSRKYHDKLTESGAPGAFFLGFIFALAFCPISAALFFGSLIPLALNSKNGIVLSFIYGIGTGVPVFIFAVAVSLGVTSLSHWFNWISKLEHYTRGVTGVIFIAAGIYYTGVYILRLFQ
ncbi:MAG: aromatic aminobenezylarsenical efflux permease ArsG family transporter [Candidatus Omnitrophica bacterium]|nr:aromatic aminobenezylarsenical efflux permease ArsG family transporter [Candidatus Omnitrophota bacterium]